MTTATVNTKKKSFTTFQMALIAVMAAITCILGPLSIPIPVSPVPISLTNLAIYLTVCLLGWKFGTISYLIYLLIGIAGLPVFSGFSSGFAKLLGPTGGYLIGFIPMAIRYPPVGPKSFAKPELKPAKTGRPAIPIRR